MEETEEELVTGDLDILEVLEAMSEQYHEHHQALLAWPWRLFCAKWVRLMAAGAKARERQAQQRAEHEWSKLQATHDQRMKGGW